MKAITSLIVSYRDRVVGRLSMSPARAGVCAFEYDAQWIADGFSISPLELPLQGGVFEAKPQPFYGNFGIFEDSMPDGYGRYLLHKALKTSGINDAELSPLDRLSIIGDGGMGALTYHPVNEVVEREQCADLDMLQQKALEVLSERSSEDASLLLFNSGNSGGARPKAVMSDADGHWLVKFRHTYDAEDIGLVEYAYNEGARRCGIEVPDFKLINGKYFASRRFDIGVDGQRIHTATAGALLCVSLEMPTLDYRNLLALTGYLTGRQADVEQMFRRMLFNYLTDNKDDHCKNFSYYVGEDRRWHLVPAYDLTYNAEGYGGQHATSINYTDKPSMADIQALASKFGISPARCAAICDEVLTGCGKLLRRRIR